MVTSTLVCAAIFYACAPRVGHVDGETDGAPPVRRTTPARTPADTGFTAALAQTLSDGAPQFTLVVTNFGDGTEVRFPNGRTHEFVVLDERDREVWRWSDGRFFTQSLQTKQLRTGATLRYQATWKDATPGTYRVIATLNSATHPRQAETLLVVH
jgi:hypothetical protein